MPTIRVDNRTGYDTADLERFFAKGLWAMGCKRDKFIKVLPTNGDSRGIAYVGRCHTAQRGACEARSIVLMLPAPERLSVRRLARLFEHEVLHTLGKSHEQMTKAEYWSQGGVPGWARGMKVRWNRRQSYNHQKSVTEHQEAALGHRIERALASMAQSPHVVLLFHTAAPTERTVRLHASDCPMVRTAGRVVKRRDNPTQEDIDDLEERGFPVGRCKCLARVKSEKSSRRA
jgi:hypothetical protein